MAVLWLREAISDDDYSPIVNIVTWVLTVSMVLSVCTKVALKAIIYHSFGADDALLAAAMIFGAGQSVAFSLQTSHGVGRHFDSLSGSQITGYEKAGYSADLLYITTLLITKISVLVLLRQISPVKTHRQWILIVGALIVSWTVASLFAVAFQCRLPDAWMILGSQCFHRFAFWMFYGVVNIISETLVILLPVYAVWNLQMAVKPKTVVITCFAVRLIVIGAVIAQLVLLRQNESSQDLTFDNWAYYLSTQFVQNLSIITACVPYIKNALLGIESGMFQTGHFHLKTLRNDSHKPQQSESTGKTSGNGTAGPSTEPGNHSNHDFAGGAEANNTARLTPSHTENTAAAEAITPTEEWDVESQSSEARIMKQTTKVMAANY